MNYHDLFVENCLRLCLQDDYGERRKLRAHNKAMDTLARLEVEMLAHGCEREFQRLLEHEDERVKLNAAAACVRRKLYHEEAVAVLRNIEGNSLDGTLSLAAEMVLKTMK